MSKTNFVDGDPSQGILGTVVPADYLNALNTHYHTGLNQDGHGALPYAADTGTANAYIVTLNPAPTQYVTGMPIYFKAANANTSVSTINVNSLGAKTIKKNGSTDLINGDIQAGQIISVSYDGTYMQLISSPGKAATLDANNRVVQTVNAIWDGTAGRSASPTPGVNIVPVSGNNGLLASGWTNQMSMILANSVNQCISNGAAYFVTAPFKNGWSSGAGVITNGYFVCPAAGVLRNLYVYGSPSDNYTYTLTVYKNDAATGLTITIAYQMGNTTYYSDLAHSVSVVAGDRITFVGTGNSASGFFSYGISVVYNTV